VHALEFFTLRMSNFASFVPTVVCGTNRSCYTHGHSPLSHMAVEMRLHAKNGTAVYNYSDICHIRRHCTPLYTHCARIAHKVVRRCTMAIPFSSTPDRRCLTELAPSRIESVRKSCSLVHALGSVALARTAYRRLCICC
jgi:hypothetical protein